VELNLRGVLESVLRSADTDPPDVGFAADPPDDLFFVGNARHLA